MSCVSCVQMTYDPSRASEVLKSFTFRDVVQGRVAIEETLSDSDSLPSNKSLLTTAQGHAPALPLSDSFIFLVRAGNVQPAKGELHFTILPHHQMRHGPGSGNKADKSSREPTTVRIPTHNRTTTGVKEGGKVELVTPSQEGDVVHPHLLSHKNHHQNRTHHKGRPHNRWGNHTRGGTHGGRTGGQSPEQQPQTPVPEKNEPGHPDTHPVYYEILPRPASDPLLIILPLLACLLLIVILMVLILVFRHRKEKQAQMRLLQELAAVQLPTEESPCMGLPERSMAMPSVVVTPLGPASCPNSPRVPISPRRRSLAPGMTFWGPFDDDGNVIPREIHEKNNLVRSSAYSTSAGFQTPLRSRHPTPTLKHSQYWV